ncbi:hypothetical protein B0H66DRAFT_219913 [Apodospora peruviana]|uniref:Uncharacterized protein n=1 Tax=Apodospora peruviana TaxID=516989 RepID=A0AAE0M4U2_9PEZI|nr:hypothetical protein B0H66DRAFT_219913 [Apodospora peruviana]
MVGNKNRLYVALYPSGVVNNEERMYHWAFLIGPKAEKGSAVGGTRYHVKNTPFGGWQYEERPVPDVRTTGTLLVRITVAKITDEARLIEIFRSVPVVQNDPNWRCRTWLAQALAAIAADGTAVGTSVLDWATIEQKARQYAAQKTAEGRYGSGANLSVARPTFDLMEGKEVIA